MLFCADAKRHRIVIFLCKMIFKNGTRFESKKCLLYVPRTRISIVFNHIQTLFPPTCSVDVHPSNLWTYVHTPLARTSIKLWSYVQRKTPLENCCLCSFSAHFMLSENRIFVRKGGVGCFYRILGDIKKDRKKGKMPILHHCVSWQRRNFATCRKLWQQYLWQKFSMLSWKSHGYNTVGIYRTHLNSVMSPKECKKTRV